MFDELEHRVVRIIPRELNEEWNILDQDQYHIYHLEQPEN